VRQDRINLRHPERYITTVVAPITSPSNYAGVNVSVDYYYTKREYRVRAVVTLPQGYAASVLEDATDADFFLAEGVFPPWACFSDPLSAGDYDYTYFRTSVGYFGLDATSGNTLDCLTLWNDATNNGTLQIAACNSEVNGDVNVYLGSSVCYDRNATTCLPDYIGHVEWKLMAPVDIDAWNAKFDVAVP
jgi:hypothetical protein